MSTDQTPALARATEALASAQRRTVTPMHALDARTAVSAALTNDADPDWLARVLADMDGLGWIFDTPDLAAEYGLTRDDVTRARSTYRAHADAVRATILGAA